MCGRAIRRETILMCSCLRILIRLASYVYSRNGGGGSRLDLNLKPWRHGLMALFVWLCNEIHEGYKDQSISDWGRVWSNLSLNSLVDVIQSVWLCCLYFLVVIKLLLSTDVEGNKHKSWNFENKQFFHFSALFPICLCFLVYLHGKVSCLCRERHKVWWGPLELQSTQLWNLRCQGQETSWPTSQIV
jgi:hypothetical protein